MNKPLQNHLDTIGKIVSVLENSGITSNQGDALCYRRLTKDPDCCHLEIYGFTHFPIKIKTAYAEDMSSNQAERYVTQMSRIRDEAFFIYHGYGWKKQTYKRALSEIRGSIGTDHVLSLKEFEEWLIAKIEEKESR